MKALFYLILAGLGISIVMLASALTAMSQEINGFDVSNATIPRDEIISGGPPRDGIPSIDAPKFVEADEVNFLKDEDIVISVERAGQVRAYPLRILVWHEIVNDVIAGEPVAVTYCPLCGTSMVFDASIDGERRTFGVSGLLYNSDVLMYDRESESLWSQLKMEAVSGPAVGTRLKWLPSAHMTWKAWRDSNPQGLVLSTDTGYRRNYAENAYERYFSSDRTMFPVQQNRDDLPTKDSVLGVVVNENSLAFPISALPDGKMVTHPLGDGEVRVVWDDEAQKPSVTNESGKEIPSVIAFWFAWQAFYPETDVWNP